ncbi:SDR family NAD(P)-dependent oxidoreductase [Tropicimonas isoalkanivorans]|uniref:SDR family NAD(P)-dependent oxidoreductase n=1 Tax=Tropicimonas isoalkanivorans TaxID=441112 RepID=UPI000B84A2BB|nr:SDR family NAD(P)-dependent oxidoreductase [Tropicimonas isoalkanivorans]
MQESLLEHDEAAETRALVEQASRRAYLHAGDIQDADHRRAPVRVTVGVFGRPDILVNNAAHQVCCDASENNSDEERERTLRTNIHAMFYLC